VDDARFDAWTRRRFGLAAGGLASAILGLAAVGEGEARKKHRRKHKRKHRKRCKPGETRCGKKCVQGTCCPGYYCGEACSCGRTVEGGSFCFTTAFESICRQCESSGDCGDEGFQCVQTDACGALITAICFAPCGFTP
jgi:hypothetical protein